MSVALCVSVTERMVLYCGTYTGIGSSGLKTSSVVLDTVDVRCVSNDLLVAGAPAAVVHLQLDVAYDLGNI